jgi:tetratricopeptide (TPR) repeat protein
MPDPEVPRTDELATGAAAGRARRLRFIVALGGAVALGAVALALWLWPAPPAPQPAVEVEDEDIDRAVAAVNPGYVGIDACAECHTQRAATVKKSRHFLACVPATDPTVAPGFAHGGKLASRSAGVRFEMTRKGSDFFVTRFQEVPGGELREPYQVALVYGSGSKHDEMYLAWEGDRLFHLPVAWLHPHGRWGQASHTTAATQTHPSCLECHNTWAAHVPGHFNQYKRDELHLGVTCERCHGPGREHTEFHRAHPNEPSKAILHPGTISRERLMDLCAQCHANAKPLGRPFSYRPGEPLNRYYHNLRPTHQEDDTTNQVRYLSESKCYQKSKMTCISCHDPHRAKTALGACLDCHESDKCKARPWLPEAVRGDCVGCHMPSRVWTHAHLYTTEDDQYLSLAPRADHRIGVYPEAAEAVVLAWLRKQPGEPHRAEAELLTAKVTQYWANEASRRARDGRFKAAMGACREALRIAPNDPGVRRQLQEAAARQAELDELSHALRRVDRADAAVPVLEKMLAIQPRSALAHGELGSVLSRIGKRQEAVEHLRVVAEYDPADAFGLTKLAEMAYQDGRTDEAAALCAKAHAINPAAPLNHHTWGLVLLKQVRWREAEEKFRQALAGDPTNVGSNDRLSEALRRQGNAAEAVRYARRAVHWSRGEDAEVLVTLADAYTAANRTADARQTLERALGAANRARSPLAATIRDRLRDLK